MAGILHHAFGWDSGAHGSDQRAGQRVTAGDCKRRRPQQVAWIGIAMQRQQRFGQRAGLVEDHGIDLGQAFQRGWGFQQHAAGKQATGGDDLNGGDCQGKGAGAGDDQHRAGRQQCGSGGDANDQKPPQEGQQGAQMDRWGVASRHPVSQDDKAPAPGFGGFDQADAFREQRAAPGRCCLDGQCAPQVQRAGEDGSAGGGIHRQALAGHQASVQRCRTRCHDAIHTDAFAGGDQDVVALCHLFLGAAANGAIRLHHGDIGGPQRQQLFGGGAGLSAGAMIQHPADQEKE